MIWLIACVVLLSLCDGLMTRKIIDRYGPKVEENRIIRALGCTNLAIFLGIAIPRATIVGLAAWLHQPLILIVLLGLMLVYQCKQVRTHWNLIRG